MSSTSGEICKINIQLASGMVGINFLVLVFLIGYIEKSLLLESVSSIVIVSSIGFFLSIFYYHRAIVVLSDKKDENKEHHLINRGDIFLNVGFWLIFACIPLLMCFFKFYYACAISFFGVVFISILVKKSIWK